MDSVAVIAMAIAFAAGGGYYIYRGLAVKRDGTAWNRLQNRAMTKGEWQATVGALFATGLVGLGMGSVASCSHRRHSMMPGSHPELAFLSFRESLVKEYIGRSTTFF